MHVLFYLIAIAAGIAGVVLKPNREQKDVNSFTDPIKPHPTKPSVSG